MIRLNIMLPLILWGLLFSNSSFAENPWILSKESNDIRVYNRDSIGSAVKSFKGEVTVFAKLTSLVALIDDTQIYPNFFYQCKSAEQIKKVGNNQSYKYIVTEMPWPIKDRDTIVHSIISQNQYNKQIEINMKALPTLLPLKKSRIRIKKMSGRWLLIPKQNGMTKVVYEMTIDPGGSLPKWLVNAMSTDIPFNTLKNLRTLVKRQEYKLVKNSFIVN